MRKWAWPHTTTLFGDEWRLEPPDQRPDLRNMATLADEIERERRITEEIADDPFKHLPFRFPSLAQIVNKQRGRFDGRWLSEKSPEYCRHWL